MDSNLFNVGDLVALISHPYYNDLTNIIIGGDSLTIPPIFIVVELFKSKQKIEGSEAEKASIKYKCIWFSSKQYRFNHAWIFEENIKLIKANTENISKMGLKRGMRLTLKSSVYELSKKKSTLNYEDNSINTGVDNLTISSSLSFISPVMFFLDASSHQSKNTLIEKKSGSTIRLVPSWDLKCSYFDPLGDKISEVLLPLEALHIIENVEISYLKVLDDVIAKSGYLKITSNQVVTVVKPKSINYRGGFYYLRAFDFLLNRISETAILDANIFSPIEYPFEIQTPSFDIENNSESATSGFIFRETFAAIKNAKERSSYIRIEYKNRNDQFTIRTLKEYKIITVNEHGFDVSYCVGFCLTRNAQRSFRIDRIQKLQELRLTFRTL